jgi:hypothetical protein
LHGAHVLLNNQMLSQLALLDLRYFPSATAGTRSNPYVQFLIARQLTLWHYQWLLVNEHPPQIGAKIWSTTYSATAIAFTGQAVAPLMGVDALSLATFPTWEPSTLLSPVLRPFGTTSWRKPKSLWEGQLPLLRRSGEPRDVPVIALSRRQGNAGSTN